MTTCNFIFHFIWRYRNNKGVFDGQDRIETGSHRRRRNHFCNKIKREHDTFMTTCNFIWRYRNNKGAFDGQDRIEIGYDMNMIMFILSCV
jgi:hypothetical protein